MSRPVPAHVTVEYPCSDGKPMAESQFQLQPLVYAITALQSHFRERSDVYVVGDMFVYYEEGNPRAVVAPDVFVVIGASKHLRHSYKLWEEPKGPDFVLEVTSRSTRGEDQVRKREVYASLGVREYWLHDPTGDYLEPRLQGLCLDEGVYRVLAPVGGGMRVHSEVLGLDLRLDEGGEFRFHDPASGEDLPAHWEMEARLEEEVTARKAAEARIAELEARLRGPRAAPPSPPES